MKAPKVDPKKYDDHMNRNKKPKNMSSTQKSLAMVRSKTKLSALRRKSMARESYGKEYQRHQQGLKDAQADMKAAKTNDQMVKAMNKKQFHAKAIQRMNRMESFACCGQCNCDPCTCEEINEKLGARSFQSPGNMIKDLGSSSSSSSSDDNHSSSSSSSSSSKSKKIDWHDASKTHARRASEYKQKAKAHMDAHDHHMQRHDHHTSKTTGVKGKVLGTLTGGKARKAAEAHKAAAKAHKAAADAHHTEAKFRSGLSKQAAQVHKTGNRKTYDNWRNKNDPSSKNINKAYDAHRASEKARSVAEEIGYQHTYISEKLSVSDGIAAWIDDFKKSDAAQFKGKSDKDRRDMAIAAYLSAKRGAKNEAKKVVITKKMQQRALSKVRAQPKDKVSLPKAPWDKNKQEDTQKSADKKPENYVAPDGRLRVRMVPTKKQVRDEGYVSAAQRKAVWATRADGGKGHPDKKGKK